MNNASRGHCLFEAHANQGRIAIRAKRVGSISWYPFSPWLNSSELGSAHLIEALLLVVKVVFVVFPNSAGIMSPQALCFGVYLAAGRIGNFSCFSPSAGRVFCEPILNHWAAGAS